MSLLTSTKGNFLVGVSEVSSPGKCNLLHCEVHKQTVHTGLKHYFGHCYQLFSCLKIRLAEAQKKS